MDTLKVAIVGIGRLLRPACHVLQELNVDLAYYN